MEPKVAHSSSVARCRRCLEIPELAAAIDSRYIPTPRFGTFDSVCAVTIGINPAPNVPGRCALPLLADFNRTDRVQLSGLDLEEISSRQDRYFQGCKSHTFFDNAFFFIFKAIDPTWTYQDGRVAHIDIVCCVTTPLWSKVDENARSQIRLNCRRFLPDTIALIPEGTWLLCNGRQTWEVLGSLNPVVEADGFTRTKQVGWRSGIVVTAHRRYPFMAWDQVVMSNEDRWEIGTLIKAEIDRRH